MFKLKTFLKPYRKELVIGPFFKLLEAIFELMLPALMASVIDVGIKNHDRPYIYKMGALMLIIAVLGMGFAFICQYAAAKAAQGFGTDLRNALYAHINSFSHSQIDKFGTASLINRISEDINNMQWAVAMLIRLVIRAPFLCIGGLVMTMMINLKISIIMFISILLFIIILFFIMNKTIYLYKIVKSKLDKIGVSVRENISGVRVIRAFAANKQEEEKFSKINDTYTKEAIRVGKVSALLNPATMLIMNFTILVIVWFSGLSVESGVMPSGQIIAFISYTTQIFIAMVVVANLVITFTKASASAKRINEVFETKSDITDPVDSDPFNSRENSDSLPSPGYSEDSEYSGNNEAALIFKNVTFAYQNSHINALENINFCLKKGQIMGIIGGTGSGKSTLINLIPRFYDVTEGTVHVNGRDVRNYKLNNLRNTVSVIPQESAVFSGTIESNIRFGKEECSFENVIASAKTAQASEFIELLTDTYSAPVRQSGTNLSGGQKQRLSIARAIMRNSDILILDDSFSALDHITESKLRKALKEHKNASGSNMTVIMVTQRINAIRDADVILVLDDGKCVGIGNHPHLMENCEIYREMSSLQLQEGDDFDKK